MFMEADRQVKRKRCALNGLKVADVCSSASSLLLARPICNDHRHPTPSRADNLFEQLNERSLTQEEEDIIRQRVRHLAGSPGCRARRRRRACAALRRAARCSCRCASFELTCV